MTSVRSDKSNKIETMQAQYRQEQMTYWDDFALEMDARRARGKESHYFRRIKEVYKFLVAPGLRILEIGCAQGDLLASLRPSFGVGLDFSWEMISRARQRHPGLHFIQADAHEFEMKETFDVIILQDVINNLWDVQSVFQQIFKVATVKTRVIMNFYSRLWEMPLALAKWLGLAKPVLGQNWLTLGDVSGLLNLTDFEVIRTWQEILWPLSTQVLSTLLNRYLVKIWPFNLAALTNFLIARPRPLPKPTEPKPLVSVIVPVRNEEGNIRQIFERTPEMGAGTELVFVEGHSRDNTYETVQKEITLHPERHCRLLKQAGQGKGDAVRLGFAEAKGEVLMILDADLTVAPEDLPRFYEALVSGKGEFINGVRLVYPMQKKAMRYINLVGNKFFSLAFTWLLGQSIKDTLCGTKVLWKADYELIAANRGYFGSFDPFGDFDLLFGAAKLNLKIIDMPIHYQERIYGDTNIQRWKHGWMLLKMVGFAALRIKFV